MWAATSSKKDSEHFEANRRDPTVSAQSGSATNHGIEAREGKRLSRRDGMAPAANHQDTYMRTHETRARALTKD